MGTTCEPIPIKAGDKRILINGCPPMVDCRIVAEERYQYTAAEITALKAEVERLQNQATTYEREMLDSQDALRRLLQEGMLDNLKSENKRSQKGE